MPELGVNIGQYVHPKMQSQLDTNLLKGLILSNCEALLPYLSSDDLYIGIAVDEDGRDVLIIKIPLVVDDVSRESKNVYYAFYRSQINELKFNFLIDDGL